MRDCLEASGCDDEQALSNNTPGNAIHINFITTPVNGYFAQDNPTDTLFPYFLSVPLQIFIPG
ncbi:hypothetical protein SARI_01705 [Salmonella enterica subsp. arizonae serovar 62:z4,z23:-]|uniref:Uncharacterized protein n=1 Tax=Salmonella arizonae (strain ATCC BAA-731 / CDC346-86 / RSK2980) TaxID=41514 RepID=A9MFJ0_SALAR|nr:hypothetical protein SARI_01705 [Salmonella enterica subsp. arizonae serovar 62:z4,z23:-]